MVRIPAFHRIAAASVMLTFAAAPASANGGDFFQEFADQMAEQNSGIGPSYFGFVRDARGRPLQGANVTATITTNGSRMTVKTDILGHYRVPGFHKEIDPGTVEISCAMAGYSQVSAARRAQRNPRTPIETDCVLSTVTAEAS